MKKIYQLTKPARQVILDYEKMYIAGKKIITPYYMNKRKAKDLQVLVGKGSPKEIQRETYVVAQAKGIDLKKLSEKELKEFLENQDIGIDCSGFVVHVLNASLRADKKKPIFHYLKYEDSSFKRKIAITLRPVSNTSANTLTSLLNTDKISINKTRPGDVIRLKSKRKNSHHILLIEKVVTEDNNVSEIYYVHSSESYVNYNGIKHSQIVIKDNLQPLEKQNWQEVENNRNWTLEGYLKDLSDNGIRRFKRVQIPFEEIIVKEKPT